jgi:hypothetical protein
VCVSGLNTLHTKFFTHSVAYPDPSSLDPYQPTVGSSPDPYSLSELSNLVAPIGPQVRRAPVGPVSVVMLSMHSLVPGMAYEVDRLRYHSREMSLLLLVPAAGTRSVLVPLEADSSEVVGVVVFAVEVAVAVAVAVDSGVADGLSHSVMMRGTVIEGFGL